MNFAISNVFLVLIYFMITLNHNPVVADEYSFVTLKLPEGVQIDVPRSWRTLDAEINRLIATARDAALDLAGLGRYSGNTLFAANSTPVSTYASVRVSVENITNSAEERMWVKNLAPHEIKRLEIEFATQQEKTLPIIGLAFLQSLGLKIEHYGSYPAMAFSYRRTGRKGDVIVELIQIFRPSSTIRINLAYREVEGGIWKVVIKKMKASILLE